MTIKEVVMIIEAFNERTKNDFKQTLALNYSLAQTIAVAVDCRLNGKQPPSLYETYPDLFAEELKEKRAKEQAAALELYKAQFLDFANRHNKRRGEKNK